MLHSQQSQQGFNGEDPMQTTQVEDLQFATSVDHSIGQNVPLPAPREYTPDLAMTGPMGGAGAGAGAGGVAEGAGASSGVRSLFRESSHPVVCLFHCLFKVLALTLFCVGGYFQSSSATKDRRQHEGANFITVTVICTLLLAADFWVVKNVTGRLLVGLRWWNQVEPNGNATTWIFESADEASRNRFDATIFWSVLYGTPVVWMLLTVLEIFRLKLSWILICAMAIALSGANVYGYYKCSKEQKAKFQQMLREGTTWGATAAFQSGILGRLFGAANPAPNNNSAPPPPTTQTYV